MTRNSRNRVRRDDVLTALGYALPVLGGLLGVVYVNINPKEFLNPVWAVGGGAILGWGCSLIIRKLLRE